MTKINLLPPEKIKKARLPAERSYLWMVIVFPLVVIVAMGAWYFVVNSQVNEKNDALEVARIELADWKAKTQALEKYRQRQEEIAKIEDVAVKALEGRVYWARILNNVALMCPDDIWLTRLSTEGTQGETGSVTFSGYALQCPNRDYFGYGIYPHYPDYRPIAGWLDRMAQIAEFERVWLSSATPYFHGATASREGVTKQYPLTGNEWYEDPYRVGTCPGVATSTGQYTCFVGDWLIQFESQAVLDMGNATISARAAGGTQSAPGGEKK